MSGWPSAHAIVNGELYRCDPSSHINMIMIWHRHIMRGTITLQAADAGSEVDVSTTSSAKIPV